MKSFCFATLLLLAVLAISTAAAFPERTLLQRDLCTRACTAVRTIDPNRLQSIIREDSNVCNCICNSNNGERLLHIAVRNRCIECIRILLSSPSFCPRNTGDFNGNTAMHLAARLCVPLPGLGLPTNVRNSTGDTPLCIASMSNNPNCVQIVRSLIDAGANGCLRCSDGRRPCEKCIIPIICNYISQIGLCSCP